MIFFLYRFIRTFSLRQAITLGKELYKYAKFKSLFLGVLVGIERVGLENGKFHKQEMVYFLEEKKGSMYF